MQTLAGPIKSFTAPKYRESIEENGFEIIKEYFYTKDTPTKSLVIAKKR